ncbi:hypothetical protein A9Q98_03215 [Thalassotalea sp. 42_200_T64]|nr:hypothetical protein A9Q98_03215 [Thalassotalea sp. 42_200_T64]
MKTKFKFTTATLKALPLNPVDSKATEREFSDTEVIGLKCLSGKTGTKKFLLRYQFNGRRKSIAIGRFPDVDLPMARQVARKYKNMIADGVDPRHERDNKHSVPTVAVFFFDTYLPLAKTKKSTWTDDLSRFKFHCGDIAKIPYDELSAHQILKIQLKMREGGKKRKVYAPATCNRVLALLKTMGKLAEQLLDITNVAARVSLLPVNNIRSRYCDLDETKRIITAANNFPCRSIGAYISLLFLTGCRCSELRLRKWDDVDLHNCLLKIPITKNKTSHIVYLSDFMVEIIRSIPKVVGNPYLFPGTKKALPITEPRCAFKIIKSQAGIPNPDDVVFHTARHSVASNFISHGVDLASVKSQLNHKSINSTMRYAKLSVGKQREVTASLSAMVQQLPALTVK